MLGRSNREAKHQYTAYDLGEWGLKSREDMDAWPREHQALLSQLSSTTTTDIILPQADHLSVLKEPAVAKAILDTIKQVRAHLPN